VVGLSHRRVRKVVGGRDRAALGGRGAESLPDVGRLLENRSSDAHALLDLNHLPVARRRVDQPGVDEGGQAPQPQVRLAQARHGPVEPHLLVAQTPMATQAEREIHRLAGPGGRVEERGRGRHRESLHVQVDADDRPAEALRAHDDTVAAQASHLRRSGLAEPRPRSLDFSSAQPRTRTPDRRARGRSITHAELLLTRGSSDVANFTDSRLRRRNSTALNRASVKSDVLHRVCIGLAGGCHDSRSQEFRLPPTFGVPSSIAPSTAAARSRTMTIIGDGMR
jgi:hypothetical protein